MSLGIEEAAISQYVTDHRDREKEILVETIKDAYEGGYDEGYEEGVREGEKRGERKGEDAGYEKGIEAGDNFYEVRLNYLRMGGDFQVDLTGTAREIYIRGFENAMLALKGGQI